MEPECPTQEKQDPSPGNTPTERTSKSTLGESCSLCGKIVLPVWIPEMETPIGKFGGFWDSEVWDGKCEDCLERIKSKLEDAEKRRRSELLEDLWKIRLGGELAYSSFTPERFLPSLPKADLKRQNLYIHGPTGTGKTHLAVALGRTSVSNPVGVLLVKPYEIHRQIRQAQDVEDESDYLNRLATIQVLIIDDLGASKETPYFVQVLYEIIDKRYMNQSPGLVITSNLSLDDLALRLGDDKVPSRLSAMCRSIHLTGSDKRLKVDAKKEGTGKT